MFPSAYMKLITHSATKRFLQIFKETRAVNVLESYFVYRKSPAPYSGCGKHAGENRIRIELYFDGTY
jgi:hypothetical protein